MRSAALALMLLLQACSLVSDESGPGMIVLEHDQTSALAVPGWIEFPSLTIRTQEHAAAPVPPFVRGVFVGGWFTPSGAIEGLNTDTPSRRILVRGRLDLSNRAFIVDGSTLQPHGETVVGVQDQESGWFYPLEQPRGVSGAGR